MSALTLGLIAAFAWGFHDICVRYVSQKTPLMAALLTVLLAGLTFHLGVMVVEDGFIPLSGAAFGYAALAGLFFLIASLGLYGAFQRGPVRLVAPVIASYPILSVAWATLRGADVSALQWGAVVAIILGVSVVAALSDTATEEVPPKGRTIFYAAISAIGFAGTFAISQMAAEMSHDLPVTLVTRLAAIGLLMGIILALKLPLWPGRAAVPVLCLMGFADGIALMSVVSAGGLPDAQYAAVSSSVFGLLTIVMAWAFLRERMTLPQWAGCAVTFCGIGYLAL
ncbi:DMT family transporter [Roseobacter weihaiensis]|uniref:DMT family transporter n=1 Tax=Roseobacter weihaiensis TaxID=2763262 RepID=UPI001D0BAEC0|nr:DMT family transporter [Roseobacter sp. H9]